MGPKKRVTASPSTPAQMKFRSYPEVTRATAKGTKPLPEPTSIGEILTKVVIYGCKKVLFIPPKIRLTAYAILFFLASLVADYMPFPKSYFSESGNIPNQLFVKFSWAWTFVLVAMFIFFTTSVYCVGDRKKMIKHFSRLVIGTVVWYVWTNIFRIIEESTGQCVTSEGTLFSVKARRACASKSGKWSSFDISGHAFLLMWCVLFITEEAKAILGWDSIKDYIRQEDYNRKQNSMSSSSSSADLFLDTPLNNLTPEQFDKIRENYGRYALLANVQLVFLTALVLLWDIMMIATALYFHVMLEKVIGALIAGLTWFMLYHGIYKLDTTLSPGLPGVGLIKYSPIKGFGSSSGASPSAPTSSKSSSRVPASGPAPYGNVQQQGGTNVSKPKQVQDLPQFMGMPLLGLRNRPSEDSLEGI